MKSHADAAYRSTRDVPRVDYATCLVYLVELPRRSPMLQRNSTPQSSRSPSVALPSYGLNPDST